MSCSCASGTPGERPPRCSLDQDLMNAVPGGRDTGNLESPALASRAGDRPMNFSDPISVIADGGMARRTRLRRRISRIIHSSGLLVRFNNRAVQALAIA